MNDTAAIADPWANTQRRYVAYCVAHGAVNPDEMIATDRQKYPGGVMSGFILWIAERWRAWDREVGHNKPHHDEEDHVRFDQWLAVRALIGVVKHPTAPSAPPALSFFTMTGPHELSDDRTTAIFMESPTGGDPLIVCTLARVHRPELLAKLLSPTDR